MILDLVSPILNLSYDFVSCLQVLEQTCRLKLLVIQLLLCDPLSDKLLVPFDP